MTTEIEIYLISDDLQSKTFFKTLTLNPGEVSHIPNLNFHDNSKEEYVIQCKANDEMTIIHKLTDVVEFQGSRGPMVLFDRLKTENKHKPLTKGQSRDYRISQRVEQEGKKTIAHARFHIAHK